VQGSFETIKHINSAYIVVTFQNLKKKKSFYMWDLLILIYYQTMTI